jgi:hypothetical protein
MEYERVQHQTQSSPFIQETRAMEISIITMGEIYAVDIRGNFLH